MENLRKLRKEYGLSQAQAAEIFHTAVRTWRGYENGRSEPSFQQLAEFADYFQVSIDFLVGHTKVRFPMDTKLDKGEEELIDLYRKLPAKGKIGIIHYEKTILSLLEEESNRKL